MGLKTLLKKNKIVIKFLLFFFGTYFVLALAYQAYLNYITWESYFPDYVTHKVAEQSYYVIDLLGYETYIDKNSKLPQMQLWIKEKPVVRIIEGCNSLSVIILFLSFIVAFKKGFKKTFLYILFGSIIIYVLNVLRIVFLTLGLYYYPEYKDYLHDIIFPLVIYGVVFLLWLYWIKNFNKKAEI